MENLFQEGGELKSCVPAPVANVGQWILGVATCIMQRYFAPTPKRVET